MRRRRFLEALPVVMLTSPTLAAACTDRVLSEEVVVMTPAKRRRLLVLRAETKFVPHDFPPLGYIGPDRPEDLAPLSAIVDQAIDEILSYRDGDLQATTVRKPLRAAMGRGYRFATDDRERIAGYLDEIWYLLGFHVALFDFAPGSAYEIPPGYAEPLPPGWTAPNRPRSIG